MSPQYRHGEHSRLPGFTEVFLGEELPKFDVACEVHAESDAMSNVLSQLIVGFSRSSQVVVGSEDLGVLDFLTNNIYNVSAFASSKGRKLEMSFGPGPKGMLDRRIWAHQARLEGTDFLRFRTPLTVLVDECRVRSRALEVAYLEWLFSPYVVAERLNLSRVDPGKMQEVFDAQLGTQDFLNTLSSFLYWLARAIARAEAEAGGVPAQEEWIPAATNF